MKKEEAIEELAETVDTLNNLFHALQMPVPAEIHVKAMREKVPEIMKKIKNAYLYLGGENVWD